MLTGVVVFMFPNDAAQIAITMMAAFFFLWLFEVLSPYKSEYVRHVAFARRAHDNNSVPQHVPFVAAEGGRVRRARREPGCLCWSAGGRPRDDGPRHCCRGRWHVLRVPEEPIRRTRSGVAERPRAGESDDVPFFESAPPSWKSFLRRDSMSEKAGPNRRVAVELLVLLAVLLCVCGHDGRLDSWVRGDGTGFLKVNLRRSAR
ncbi:unnamed protein product [Ectocarpus sp. 6 AP-2014]